MLLQLENTSVISLMSERSGDSAGIAHIISKHDTSQQKYLVRHFKLQNLYKFYSVNISYTTCWKVHEIIIRHFLMNFHYWIWSTAIPTVSKSFIQVTSWNHHIIFANQFDTSSLSTNIKINCKFQMMVGQLNQSRKFKIPYIVISFPVFSSVNNRRRGKS